MNTDIIEEVIERKFERVKVKMEKAFSLEATLAELATQRQWKHNCSKAFYKVNWSSRSRTRHYKRDKKKGWRHSGKKRKRSA